jgi:hypothetical protein
MWALLFEQLLRQGLMRSGSKHNQAPINDTVMRTSANTAPMIPIIEMNVNDAITNSKRKRILGARFIYERGYSLWKSDLKGKDSNSSR